MCTTELFRRRFVQVSNWCILSYNFVESVHDCVNSRGYMKICPNVFPLVSVLGVCYKIICKILKNDAWEYYHQFKLKE